ncbi:hypothetical protein A9798_06335 [Edwardsiella hoshinae]|uniref:Uncharacterized protein n=1 Tax=Edwardsiella hoshinae TaxID=93378 RepID=A0ABN4SUY4_9GAMM|nr:hypothetical protein A9798_06335 [Edwardsiella hoshinae]
MRTALYTQEQDIARHSAMSANTPRGLAGLYERVIDNSYARMTMLNQNLTADAPSMPRTSTHQDNLIIYQVIK